MSRAAGDILVGGRANASGRRLFLGGLGAAFVALVGLRKGFASSPARHGVPGASGVTRGRGAGTTFGSVAVLGATRRPRYMPTERGHAVHTGATVGDTVNHTWAERVLVELEVHNGTDHPMLFSPGQLRLKVGNDGLTVTPYDASRPPGPLAAGATERLWVGYLAPADAHVLTAEFSDPRADATLSFDLPAVQHPQHATGAKP